MSEKEKLIQSIASLLKGKPISEVKDLLFEVRKYIEKETVV